MLNSIQGVGGAPQPGKAAHLGEEKPWFQTSAALRDTCSWEQLQESTPTGKPELESLRQLLLFRELLGHCWCQTASVDVCKRDLKALDIKHRELGRQSSCLEATQCRRAKDPEPCRRKESQMKGAPVEATLWPHLLQIRQKVPLLNWTLESQLTLSSGQSWWQSWHIIHGRSRPMEALS